MRTRLAVIVAILTFIASNTAYASETVRWICIGDKSMGFNYEGKQWVHRIFSVEKKYIIALSDGIGSVKIFGKDDALCEKTWDILQGQTKPAPRLNCQGSISWFIFDKSSNRYMNYYIGDYLYDPKTYEIGRPETPYIEIGTCSPL